MRTCLGLSASAALRRPARCLFATLIVLAVAATGLARPAAATAATAAATATTAASNDPVPEGPHTFPPDYGPNPAASFSPLRVPEGALELLAAATAAAASGGDEGTGGLAISTVYLALNVAARQLYIYQDGVLAFVLPTAVGRIHYHTPIGRYSFIGKAINPTWHPFDGRPPVPPGPANPLGTRWMCWRADGYGLHGTNAEWSIGHAVSHGCVRLHNADAEMVFELVRIGTTFDVVYEPVEVAAFPAWTEETEPGLVLSLFPDIYERLPDYRAFLETRLGQVGRTVEPALLDELLKALAKYEAVTYDTASPVFCGTRRVETPIVRLGPLPAGTPLVGLRAVGEALGLAVGWDVALGLPTLAGRPVPATLIAGRAYAAPADIATAAGLPCDVVWEALSPLAAEGLIRHRLTFYSKVVTVDGLEVSRQAFYADGGIHVPLRPVAEALGLPVAWDPASGAVLVSGVPIPARIVDGRSYVLTAELAKLLEGRATVEATADGVFITGQPAASGLTQ